MKNSRTSSALTSFQATLVVASLAGFSILVAYLQLSWLQTVFLLPAPVLLSYLVVRVAVGMPATIKGNALPERYAGRRYQLVAMPVNHFGERLRWCMDLIGAEYEETTVGGILSIMLRGRTVPWLVDRQSCSLIGNSDEAIWYLSAVHVPCMTRQGREQAQRLLRRDADTIAWERRLNILGHAIQGWAYYYLLAPRAKPEHSLRLWGGMEPRVPALHRWTLRLGYPVFKALMRRAFNLSDVAAHETRGRIIRSMLDDVDARLQASDGEHILGANLSYVDVGFCALMGPLLPKNVLPHWANGRFDSFTPLSDGDWPDELAQFEQELLARPSGQYVKRMFEQWRSKTFADPGAELVLAEAMDLAHPGMEERAEPS